MKVIEQFISELKVGSAQKFGRLVIRPIISKSDFSLPLLTLKEAMDKNAIEVLEKNEGGDVPELLVRNLGLFDVIILEGEELRGAKQNRIANTTTIVPAQSEIILPVTCVERGRWNYVSTKFSAEGNVIYPSLRKSSHEAVGLSMKSALRFESDQSKTWSNITTKMRRMQINSRTEASSDIAQGVINPEINDSLKDNLKYRKHQIGFLAFIDGGFAGGDVFGSPELCEKQFESMIRGYYLDAADEGIVFPKVKPQDILPGILSSVQEAFESIGKGKEIRFEDAKIQGAWNVSDERISHLTVFPK